MDNKEQKQQQRTNQALNIFGVSECLTYLQGRLKKAKYNLNDTEVEKNYFKYLGQKTELETIIEHVEAKLNIR